MHFSSILHIHGHAQGYDQQSISEDHAFCALCALQVQYDLFEKNPDVEFSSLYVELDNFYTSVIPGSPFSIQNYRVPPFFP